MRAVAVIAGVVLVLLSAGLPANGFYSGDSGVKLIAARNAMAHPTRPFEIDLPTIAAEPVALMDRFFFVHGDHAHALQSPVFPIVAAPAIAMFGTRGAYVLPIVSFVLLLPFLDVVRRHYAQASSWGLFAVGVLLLNPLFFYALEFWEHTPAVACAAAATALVLSSHRARATTIRMLAAGLLAGVAVLFRPEAIWYAGGLALIAIRKPGGVAYVGALTGVGALFMTVNYVEFGNLFGPHAAANLAPLVDGWASARWLRFRLWLVPESLVSWVGLLLILGAWVMRRADVEIGSTQAVALLGAAIVAVDAATGSLVRDSLWHAWPAGLLLFVPTARGRQDAELWWLGSLTVAGILISSTHDGGAQWGPRFLLIALPALLPLAAFAADASLQPGPVRAIRCAALLLILAAGLSTTRGAHSELRSAKRYNAELVDAVARHATPGGYIVSNVWWFDQIAADLYGTRTFLFTATPDITTTTLRRLAEARVRDAALVWTAEPDGASLADAVRGTCFRETARIEVRQRQLTLLLASCHDQQP